MADKKYSNPCPRCGKERIFVKTWKEKIGYSTITTTETACPDKECQSMINKEMKKLKTTRQDREQKKIEANNNRKKEALKNRSKKRRPN